MKYCMYEWTTTTECVWSIRGLIIEYLIKNRHSFCRLVGRRGIWLSIFNAIRYAHSTTIENNPPRLYTFCDHIMPSRIFGNIQAILFLWLYAYGWKKLVFFCEPFFSLWLNRNGMFFSFKFRLLMYQYRNLLSGNIKHSTSKG